VSRAFRLALSLLTVFPVRAEADRRTARLAIGLAPLVGLLLGVLGAAVLFVLGLLGAPGLLAGFLVVGLFALLTRGMHVDGLADTADGLGCYGPPERALAVMRDSGVGAFAVVTLVVVLGAQAASLGVLAGGRLAAVPLALGCGRAAFTWCCRRGVPPARPEGMGSLVAGSQPALVPVLWWLLLAGAAVFVVPGRPWAGPLAVLVAALAVILLGRHARLRFGGVTGDVLGAACELATTVVLAGCVL
jgi:adenosylcobinamide-GDP ribazoletransferase